MKLLGLIHCQFIITDTIISSFLSFFSAFSFLNLVNLAVKYYYLF